MKQNIIAYLRSHTPETQGILWMISACFWFSVMATLIRYISQGMHPFEIVFFRNVFSVICILPWVTKIDIKNISTKRLRLYGYRTISSLCGGYMLFYALSIIPLTATISLTFTVPLITILLAIIFLNEKVEVHQWAALFSGLLGVVVIIRPGSETFQYASLWVLVSATCWAISNILIKKLTVTDRTKTIVFIMMIITAPLSLPLALLVWQAPTIEQLIWLFILGWVSNMAQISITHSYAKTDMNVVLPFDFSRLIFISIMAYIFFNETFDIWTVAGAIIIFSSSIYLARKAKKKVLIYSPYLCCSTQDSSSVRKQHI